MKKFLILISLVLILFACDRFEHILEPSISNIGLSEFANSMAELFSNTNQNNFLEISFLFSDNYFNQDTTKDEKYDYFTSFFLIDPNTTFIADNITISPSLHINWHFTATNSNHEILADTTFIDFLIKENEGFVFYGDQNNKKKVMVELFTGKWCSNCPNAEDALHELRMQYGSRFSYVEYHFGDDELVIDDPPIFYYPFAGTLPFGIVNGNSHIVYSAPSVEDVKTEIDAAITPLLQEPLLASLSNVQINMSDTLLTGSVQIDLDPVVSTDNLALVAVLMENYNDEYLNYHDEPHHNIALKRETIDISELDLREPVSFELTELNTLPQWYMDNSTGLPDDLTLVLWIQTLEIPYNQNTCAVHNVIEVQINN